MGWDLHLLTTKLKVKLLQFYTQQTAIIKAGNKRLKNGTLPHSKKYYFKVPHGLIEKEEGMHFNQGYSKGKNLNLNPWLVLG